MKTNQIISIIICTILFSLEYQEINNNIRDLTNIGYIYFFLAIILGIYRI